jgi:hypothetical protein
MPAPTAFPEVHRQRQISTLNSSNQQTTIYVLTRKLQHPLHTNETTAPSLFQPPRRVKSVNRPARIFQTPKTTKEPKPNPSFERVPRFDSGAGKSRLQVEIT